MGDTFFCYLEGYSFILSTKFCILFNLIPYVLTLNSFPAIHLFQIIYMKPKLTLWLDICFKFIYGISYYREHQMLLIVYAANNK